MIHHLSISATRPQHVAEVLAELMGGRSYRALARPDSWMAVSGDEVGTMVEVYPAESVGTAPFRFLLSVRADLGTILEIGRREGWRTEMRDRGVPGETPLFSVVEFWIENRIVAEIVPEDMMDGYMDLMQVPVLDQKLAA